LKDKKGEYSIPNRENILASPSKLYLLDSGSKRMVKGLVPLFAEQASKAPETYKELVIINDGLIDTLLGKKSIKALFKALSQFHFDHMTPMIPDHLIPLWKDGLDSDDFYIKICGAGGGGYCILYSENENLQDKLKGYQLEPIILT
jgi:mevalonate kinase